MERRLYERMFDLESSYWWFVGTKKVIFSILSRALNSSKLNILDLGCGSGMSLLQLRNYGTSTGLDFSPDALGFCLRRGIKRVVCAKAEDIPFKSNSFDLVTAFDLLEHMERDDLALKEIQRVCKKHGIVFFTLPAFNFLWSGHDEALSHQRRYTKKSILQKLKGTNFIPLRISYFNTLFFFPIFFFRLANRFILKKKKGDHEYRIPGFFNQFLATLFKLESFFLRYINFPFGVSLFCLARKTG